VRTRQEELRAATPYLESINTGAWSHTPAFI
jgi:hypothetical protein